MLPAVLSHIAIIIFSSPIPRAIMSCLFQCFFFFFFIQRALSFLGRPGSGHLPSNLHDRAALEAMGPGRLVLTAKAFRAGLPTTCGVQGKVRGQEKLGLRAAGTVPGTVINVSFGLSPSCVRRVRPINTHDFCHHLLLSRYRKHYI